MRKNLFLTLALLLATFAGATAENWSVTMDGTIGLPGDTAVNEKGEKYLHFQSGLIKVDAPTRTLRFTVAGTVNNEKPNGNNFIFALSELNIYNADMSKELTYTATSNADHNSLSGSFDGKGLPALNDGKYDNFFHSVWASTGAVAEYHYIEVTLEEEVDRFVIEWGSRASSMKNAPTVVGLTKGGVEFVPYTDRTASFSDEKITSLDELTDGAYFTIRGNAPATYHTYNNNTGEQTSKEPVEGSGPMYTKPGGDGSPAQEPAIAHIAQLIPAEGDTYYIYFPVDNAYMCGDGAENQFNTAENGWQFMTKDINKAAQVEITPLANGDFEMRYPTTRVIKENGEVTFDYDDYVYIAADPRSGKMKTFSEDRKTALESNGWCQGFGLVCAFNWSFYGADYQAPVWAKEYELGLMYIKLERLMNAIENNEYLIENEYVSELEGYIEEFNETFDAIDDLEEGDIKEFIDEKQVELSNFIFIIADEEFAYMDDSSLDAEEYGWNFWSNNSSSEFKDGNWSREAYDLYIQKDIDFLDSFINGDEVDPDYCFADYIDGVTSYFANKESNIAAFLATEYKAISLPKTFKVESILEQEAKIDLSKSVNGFRWTLTKTASGNKNDEGQLFTSFTEMEVLNGKGEKVALTADLISSNATHDGDGGGIPALVDGSTDTYWHAMWGGQSHNPSGPTYIDVKFPEGTTLSNFTIKFTNRSGQLHNAQTEFVISEYGKAYDDLGVDYHNVSIGNKVTDLSQLKDGGFYVLQGNLRANLGEESSRPRFYSGNTPYTVDRASAANVDCVYMFKKVGDGWNILSLSAAKYLAGTGLTIFKSEADNVKIADSQNMADTWVIYNEIDTISASDYTYEVEEGTSISFAKVDVPVKAFVYMDWDGGMAGRPCYSALPGVADPRFTELTDEMKLTSSCGDYLHFNKTNGEGEWTIYEASIENEYYAYMLGLVEESENLKFTAGINPGCINVSEETIAEFNEAKAAAAVAAEYRETKNAEAIAKRLATAIDNIGDTEVVGFEPTAVYRIESAYEAFLENTGYTRSIYAAAGALAWGVTPSSFDGENYDFLFRISNDEDEMEGKRVEVAEEEKGKAYILQNVGNGNYIGKDWAYAARPAYVVIVNLEDCVYNIKNNKANGSGIWHANNHGSGNGRGSNLVTYGGGVNSASAWTFIYVGEADDYELSVEDVVVNGEEVVSVNYFTPAGTAIAEPVKGINIVVKVYANGVVEATKVLVK